MKKYLLNRYELLLFIIVLFIAFGANQTFLSKMYQFASVESNTSILWFSPFILVLLLFSALHVVLIPFSKSVSKLLIALLLLISALCAYFIDSFGTIIDKDMITNMLETDTAEVLDLFTLKLFLYLIFLFFLPSAIFWQTRFEKEEIFKGFIKRAIVAFLLLVVVSGVYMSVSKSYSSFFRNHKELKMYLNPYYPIASSVKYVQAFFKADITIKPIAQDAKKAANSKPRVMIFVLGETQRAANFSLNGYTQLTNPLLGKREDIISFTNFYSCGTATAVSVPCMFAKFGHDAWSDDKKYYENIIDVLQKVGTKIIYRDNNSGGSKGIADRVKDVKYWWGKEYDSILLQDLEENLANISSDTFILLHVEGSHGPTYFKRYSDNYRYFKPTCDTQDLEKCTQEMIVNTYDNTIVYADFIINETIEALKKYEKEYAVALWFISDHGESLGENGIYLHGLPYFIAPDTQKHVPSVLYVGDVQRYKALKQKEQQAYSHDNIFHTILGFYGVQTNEYDRKLDMLR
ncbi:MAG: phosphoethanolamine--lipid A transferase [Sulfurospirillum sp.]|nr:phosphoethanolamine--lipid A transferase [Sulfurospirillum sp.]